MNNQFCSFNVEEFLREKRMVFKQINEDYMLKRSVDLLGFINKVILEFENDYPNWDPKTIEWLENPMEKKFEFSYSIEKETGEILLVNLSSIYKDYLHSHCTFVSKEFRGHNLAKLHLLKICQDGLEKGIRKYERMCNRHNSKAIILHLRMGFKIESIRKEEQVILRGDLEEIYDKTLHLLK